jgi:hypothetical protein
VMVVCGRRTDAALQDEPYLFRGWITHIISGKNVADPS